MSDIKLPLEVKDSVDCIIDNVVTGMTEDIQYASVTEMRYAVEYLLERIKEEMEPAIDAFVPETDDDIIEDEEL